MLKRIPAMIISATLLTTGVIYAAFSDTKHDKVSEVIKLEENVSNSLLSEMKLTSSNYWHTGVKYDGRYIWYLSSIMLPNLRCQARYQWDCSVTDIVHVLKFTLTVAVAMNILRCIVQ